MAIPEHGTATTIDLILRAWCRPVCITIQTPLVHSSRTGIRGGDQLLSVSAILAILLSN